MINNGNGYQTEMSLLGQRVTCLALQVAPLYAVGCVKGDEECRLFCRTGAVVILALGNSGCDGQDDDASQLRVKVRKKPIPSRQSLRSSREVQVMETSATDLAVNHALSISAGLRPDFAREAYEHADLVLGARIRSDDGKRHESARGCEEDCCVESWRREDVGEEFVERCEH